MRSIVFAVAACSLLVGGPALGAAGDYLIVVRDRVNVRSGPGTDRPVSMLVFRNELVVEIQREGDWVQMEIARSGGARGWIHASLLAPRGGGPPAPPPALPRTVEQGAPAAAPAAAPETVADQSALAGPATAALPAPSAVPPQAPQQAEPAGLAAPPAGAPAEVTPPDTRELAATAPAAPEPAGAPTSEAPTPDAIPPVEASDVASLDLQRFRDSVAYLNSRLMSVAGVHLFTEVEPLGGGVVQVGATDVWASIPPAGQRRYANVLLDRWWAATGRADRVKVQIVDQSGQVIMEESKP
jgi:uncharacterized protein YraI